ncbi:MAG: tRNA lysidine(34) synthetase TilS [Pseudanabaenaceae cyanobacterium]
MNPFKAVRIKVNQALRQYPTLLPPQTGLLLAISGGQDSLCLLEVLRTLQPKWGWRLLVAHCNHRWRDDADLNADHVVQLCQRWQIPSLILTQPDDIPKTEAGARQWRYSALTALAQNETSNRIVTGHTLTDRAETLLFNLCRGSGAAGLSALGWQRDLTPDIKLVRPLLHVHRDETLAVCQQRNLPIWEDSTNHDVHYRRNRLRHEVMPYLTTHFNPQLENALSNLAEILTAESDYLETQAQAFWTYPDQVRIATSENNPALDRHALNHYPLALQRRIIRHFLQHNLGTMPTFEQIQQVHGLINAPHGSRTAPIHQNISVAVSQNWLILQIPPKCHQNIAKTANLWDV